MEFHYFSIGKTVGPAAAPPLSQSVRSRRRRRSSPDAHSLGGGPARKAGERLATYVLARAGVAAAARPQAELATPVAS